MAARVPLTRRLAVTASWPLGMAWTSWSYVWRILPVFRREEEGSLEQDLPPPLPESVSQDEIQLPQDGFGPLLHRTYSGTIVDSRLSAEELMGVLSSNPDTVAPRRLARFRKLHGHRDRMHPGDEFIVHLPGPWDGPVRVVEVAADRFRFATLSGHLEAGQIQWRVWPVEQGVAFAVESWARGGDRFSAFVHDRLRMAKEVQLYMWTSVAERVARTAGGRLLDGVHVLTRRLPPESFSS